MQALALAQDPQPGALASGGGAPSDPSWSQWLWHLSQSDGVVELLVSTIVVAFALISWWRLSRLGDRIRSRALLNDYFLGIEQALHGDATGAEERLQRVVSADPENCYARLLLGDVHLMRNRPEKAHAEHLLLRDAFAVRGSKNALQLGRALLAAGRPSEAADAALATAPIGALDRETLEFAFRARMQAGQSVEASQIGSALLSVMNRATKRMPDTARDQQLRSHIASAWIDAGTARLRAGDLKAADAMLRKARSLAPAANSVALLQARIEANGVDARIAAQKALGLGAHEGSSLSDLASPAVDSPSRDWLPRIASLWAEERWRCSCCGNPLPSQHGRCSLCLAEGQARVDEPALFAALEAPDRVADAIEANAAHVRRACDRALACDEVSEEFQAATRAVLDLGPRVIAELLPEAMERNNRADRAVELLRLLGPDTTSELFRCADAIESKRWLSDGGALANAVGRVLQGFDRAALPHVRDRFASAKASSRQALIDYFLGLADMREFQTVLERFPPIEIFHRMRKAEVDALRRFLQAVVPGSFVAESLLAEPLFTRDVDLLKAIPGAQHPNALESLLIRREPSRELFDALFADLQSEPEGGCAFRVLRGLATRAMQPLLSALLDPDMAPVARERIATLLAQVGAAVVEPICSNFGSDPTETDDALRSVLVRIGDEAIPSLHDAYLRPTLMERFSVGWLANGNPRRRQIVLTLRMIGSAAASRSLSTLRTLEADVGMQVSLDEALHGIAARKGDAHGA